MQRHPVHSFARNGDWKAVRCHLCLLTIAPRAACRSLPRGPAHRLRIQTALHTSASHFIGPAPSVRKSTTKDQTLVT